jgi:predicted porin
MNKKVMALAVAGALVAPAAALAQVTIGGSLTVFYYQHDPDNNSVGQKGDILESSEPEIYVRAEDKLGGGYSAWFQCTSSMDAFITGAASAAGWCARNSAVGFRGGFGNLFLGNWDTPEKLIFNRARGWFGGTNAFTGGSAVLLQGGTASGVGNPVATAAGTNNPGAFFRRQASSVNYHSPNWGGFSFMAAYSADNESTGRPDANLLDPRMFSLGGQFATGPFYVGIGYEAHQDYNPAAQVVGSGATSYGGGDDTNVVVVLGFRMGGFDVRALYSKVEYETTNTTKLEADGFGIFADWNISGPHTLRAQYVQVGDTSGTSSVSVGSYKGPTGLGCGAASNVSCANNTGADLMAIFYSYALSKRTEVSVGYSAMGSDSGSTFSKGKTANSAGGTQKTTGLVIRHRF